jgi:protein involved in polysaccharide export with SLBB domain
LVRRVGRKQGRTANVNFSCFPIQEDTAISFALRSKQFPVPIAMKRLFCFLLAGLSALADGSESSTTGSAGAVARPWAVAVSEVGTTNLASASSRLGSAGGYVADNKYKLRAGDKVSFQILEDRDVPKSLTVADSGELDIPYIGRVPASDKTCKELVAVIKEQLEREYYYRASVVLALDQASKFLGRVYVWGQVRTQGPIDIAVNENITAGKAILRAGGFADFANKKKVKLVRGGTGLEHTGKEVILLNMVDILDEGKTEQDVALRPDDSIIVGSRLINF